MKGYSEKILG